MALAFVHGPFGRAALYRISKPLAPHAHREGHLIFLVDGADGLVRVDGDPVAVTGTQAVAVTPWQPHEFWPRDRGRGAVFLVLYIAPQWFGECATGAPFACASPNVRVDRAIDVLVRQTASMLADGRLGPALAHALRDLTLESFEAARPIAEGEEGGARFRRCGDYRIRKALKIMNERLTEAIVLDGVARDSGLSRPHFYKLFRETLGITPNMYLNTLRVERSIERLVSSVDPVTAIGLDLGFASQASFTRFFSNNVGIAPTDYRRRSLLFA